VELLRKKDIIDTHDNNGVKIYFFDNKIDILINDIIIKKMITISRDQTKDWRKSQSWYKGGKSNECEIYQREQITNITKTECPKTNMRINIRTLELKENSSPLLLNDGFDWSEDFDGKQTLGNIQLYYNLKMICDSGGAQTRSLREVYHFIEAQMKYLLNNPDNQLYFINILDGNTSYSQKNKFTYLLSLPEYAVVSNKIFVDDMFHFQDWYNSLLVK
jgi:hypothetical protein